MRPCDWCDHETQATCPQCGGDGYQDVAKLRESTKERLDQMGEDITQGFTFIYHGEDGNYIAAVTLRKFEDRS